MENILVAGVNTRAVACSVKKLGYNVYSSDYFGTMDLRRCVHKFNSILDQKPLKSCGKFTENFNSQIIGEMAREMSGEVDGIICLAGVSPHQFPKRKIIGNYNIELVEDKYRLMKKLEKHFKVPETYLLKDIDEAMQIINSYPDKKFILKPRFGAGGYGVRMFNDHLETIDNPVFLNKIENGKYILQEFIEGKSVSASVIATSGDTQTLFTSRQIIGDQVLGQMEPFGYCGNVVPSINNPVITGSENSSISTEDSNISKIAQKVVAHLSLVGSNGVDLIINNDGAYVIEVNPRLQGTFECAEASLEINMAEIHLAACQGDLLNVPQPSKFSVKLIVHAHQRTTVGKLDYEGVYDLPNQGVIIEKGEPVVTVLTSSQIKEDAIYSARGLVQKVYNHLS